METKEKIRICLLGRPEIRVGDQTLRRFPTKKSRSLFALLVMNEGRRLSRDYLAGLFWGELSDEAARRCLRTEIWRLRKTLAEEVGVAELIECEREDLGLDSHGLWVDLHELESCLREARMSEGPQKISSLKKAVELYRGDLLEGVYESWCEVARERLRAQHVSALDQLMVEELRLGSFENAIAYGDLILQIDPLIEHVHQAVMWCYWQIGDRSAALRRYGLCRQVLASDLDLEPTAETTALYQAIRLRIRDGRLFDSQSFFASAGDNPVLKTAVRPAGAGSEKEAANSAAWRRYSPSR